MKIIELTNHMQVHITNEEAEMLERFSGDISITKSCLSEREQVLANQLTIKDILLRTNTDGKIYYKKRI
jgi:hypothetical protein